MDESRGAGELEQLRTGYGGARHDAAGNTAAGRDDAARHTALIEFEGVGHTYRALLGRSPQHDNVYLTTGCSGHGVMHAPALGELMAEMIVDGKTSIDVSALRPDRF